MRKIKNELINWIKDKKNFPYVIFLVIGVAMASYKYSFVSAVIGFFIIIIFGLIVGFVINRLIK